MNNAYCFSIPNQEAATLHDGLFVLRKERISTKQSLWHEQTRKLLEVSPFQFVSVDLFEDILGLKLNFDPTK